MRLIDADVYYKEVQEYVFPITAHNLMGAADAYYRCVHLLEEAPTIDPEELRPKGRWEEEMTEDEFGKLCLDKCSVCGGFQYTQSNYCPNCGAKMEVEE